MSILKVVGSIFSILTDLWRSQREKVNTRKKMAKKAKEELEDAKKKDDPSSFIDGFGNVS